MPTCKWPLGNGETLEFNIYSPDPPWNQVAGLYIFTYLTKENRWRAVYVGQADDFSTRIVPSHEKWDSARRIGATHVHARVVPSLADRDRWEKMLIQYLQPPLNVQHR